MLAFVDFGDLTPIAGEFDPEGRNVVVQQVVVKLSMSGQPAVQLTATPSGVKNAYEVVWQPSAPGTWNVRAEAIAGSQVIGVHQDQITVLPSNQV